jgi:hypothetical protein
LSCGSLLSIASVRPLHRGRRGEPPAVPICCLRVKPEVPAKPVSLVAAVLVFAAIRTPLGAIQTPSGYLTRNKLVDCEIVAIQASAF